VHAAGQLLRNNMAKYQRLSVMARHEIAGVTLQKSGVSPSLWDTEAT